MAQSNQFESPSVGNMMQGATWGTIAFDGACAVAWGVGCAIPLMIANSASKPMDLALLLSAAAVSFCLVARSGVRFSLAIGRKADFAISQFSFHPPLPSNPNRMR